MRRTVERKCEHCGGNFLAYKSEVNRGRARFCNRKCAALRRKPTPHPKSQETREKIRASMKAYWDKVGRKKKKELAEQGKYSQVGKNKIPKSILNLSKRTIMKICRRLELSCSICGWKEEICDLHHIVPRRKGGTDDHSNLACLCPNCHRLAGKGKIEKFVTLDVQIGDSWIKHYYG